MGVAIAPFGHGGPCTDTAIGAEATSVPVDSTAHHIGYTAALVAGGARRADNTHTGILDTLAFNAEKAAITSDVFARVIHAFTVAANAGERTRDAGARCLTTLSVNAQKPLSTPVGRAIVKADAVSTALVGATARFETEVRHAGQVTTNLSVWTSVGAMTIGGEAPAQATIGTLGTGDPDARVGTASVLADPTTGAVRRPARGQTVTIDANPPAKALVDLTGIGTFAVTTGVGRAA